MIIAIVGGSTASFCSTFRVVGVAHCSDPRIARTDTVWSVLRMRPGRRTGCGASAGSTPSRRHQLHFLPLSGYIRCMLLAGQPEMYRWQQRRQRALQLQWRRRHCANCQPALTRQWRGHWCRQNLARVLLVSLCVEAEGSRIGECNTETVNAHAAWHTLQEGWPCLQLCQH